MNNSSLCTDSNLIEHNFRESRKIMLPDTYKKTKTANVSGMRYLLKNWYKSNIELADDRQGSNISYKILNTLRGYAQYVLYGKDSSCPIAYRELVESYRPYISQLTKTELKRYMCMRAYAFKHNGGLTVKKQRYLEALQEKIDNSGITVENCIINTTTSKAQAKTPCTKHISKVKSRSNNLTKLSTSNTPVQEQNTKENIVLNTNTVTEDFVSLLAKLKETGLAEITIKFKV